MAEVTPARISGSEPDGSADTSASTSAKRLSFAPEGTIEDRLLFVAERRAELRVAGNRLVVRPRGRLSAEEWAYVLEMERELIARLAEQPDIWPMTEWETPARNSGNGASGGGVVK